MGELGTTDPEQWIVTERCRVVALLGIVNWQSALAAKLGQQIQTFEVVVWRSLQNAPPFEEWLETVLPICYRPRRGHRCTEQPGWETTEADAGLRQSAVYWFWTMLNDFECRANRTVSSGLRGIWSTVQRDWGGVPSELLAAHQPRKAQRNCATGRSDNQHEHCYCRDYNPKPDENCSKGILQVRNRNGKISGHYRGNPLALKLVAAATQELFNGRIVEVLNCAAAGLAVFDDIRDLLQRQFDRLSEIEQEMIVWLAINRRTHCLS